MYSEKQPSVTPRIIIHGGAGNITRENTPPEEYKKHRDAMLGILHKAKAQLDRPHATALDVATYAVSLLEDDPMFNAGHGAVYTTAGTHELEASVVVSRGYRKRGVGVMKVRTVRNPIKLAREMLIQGEKDDGGGAGGHCQLEGETCEHLAKRWGLKTVRPSYYWTRRRWNEHRIGLGLKHDDETYEKAKKHADKNHSDGESVHDIVEDFFHPNVLELDKDASWTHPTWDKSHYLPQGTVGAVVLDSSGTICAATSTGGLTNKLPGRIGDTPTIGAGFHCDEWMPKHPWLNETGDENGRPSFAGMLSECLPFLSGYTALHPGLREDSAAIQAPCPRAVGCSGTGNGDSFLRLSAARTTTAIARFAPSHPYGRGVPLQDAISEVAGPFGMLQKSAEDRWNTTGEGQGGMIGIDFENGRGKVCFDFNCGGLFHAWIDDVGNARFAVFQDRKDE